MMPEVTVIMPAFNAAAYIREAIASALAQTFGDFELIVVDDGSTDDTTTLVQEISDGRIRCAWQANTGPAAARNHGIDLARGEWIAFLDADDLWDPRKLALQRETIAANPAAGFIYCATERIDEHGASLGVVEIERHRGWVMPQLIDCNFVSTGAVMVRRDLAARERFRGGRDGVEDWDLWLRLAEHTQFDYVDLPLDKYREHAAGISKQDGAMYLSRQVTLRELQKHLQDDYTGPDRERLLQLCRRTLARTHLVHGHVLLQQGRKREARQTMAEARRQDALNPRIWWGLLKAAVYGLKS